MDYAAEIAAGAADPQQETVAAERRRVLELSRRMLSEKERAAGLRIPRTTAISTGPGAALKRRPNIRKWVLTRTLVSAKEGQKLVIGRGSLDGPSTALFLVLVGKVVN